MVWPIFGQEILNGDMGAGFHGIQITSGLFHVWRAWGITNETQLLALAIGVLADLSLSWALGPDWASSLGLIAAGWGLFTALASRAREDGE